MSCSLPATPLLRTSPQEEHLLFLWSVNQWLLTTLRLWERFILFHLSLLLDTLIGSNYKGDRGHQDQRNDEPDEHLGRQSVVGCRHGLMNNRWDTGQQI